MVLWDVSSGGGGTVISRLSDSFSIKDHMAGMSSGSSPAAAGITAVTGGASSSASAAAGGGGRKGEGGGSSPQPGAIQVWESSVCGGY